MSLTHRRSRGRYVVAVLLLASLTLITLNARGSGALRTVRNGAATVLSPVESTIHSGLRPVGNFLAGAADYGSLKAKYNKLQSEYVAEQGTEAQQLFLKQQEQEALKQLGLSYAGQIKTVAAVVVSQPTSNFETTVELDKGTANGVAIGQPVVNTSGLVGKVTEAAAHTSTVELLTDPNFYCGVTLAAQSVGQVQGQGLDRALKVTALPTNGHTAKLKRGQELYTTSLGMTFPAGIPVGRISTIDTNGSATVASVTPAADTSNLDYLDVMLWSGQS